MGKKYYGRSSSRTRKIYEERHGPIPEGHHIHHKDGKPWNEDDGNHECLTPKEHAKRHIEMGSRKRAVEIPGGVDLSSYLYIPPHRRKEMRDRLTVPE
jgi:hypothetical protein